MGNRCVITDEKRSISIYLHWNGGIGSVEAFLKYCELKGSRGFGEDSSYASARLIQVIANFFGGTLSIGVSAYTTDKREDPGDNGIYVVDGWKIVKHLRSYSFDDPEMEEVDIASEKREYDLNEMLESIDESQPKGEQLGEYLTAKEIDAHDVNVGDYFYISGIEGEPRKVKCIGKGDGEVWDRDMTGLPYCQLYKSWTEEECKNNRNCYPDRETVKVIRA